MKTINPTALSPSEALFLKVFLETFPKQTLWKKNTDYLFTDTLVQLTHNIVSRARKEGHDGLRYEVLSDKIVGSGGSSQIYEIKGTLTPTEDGLRFRLQTAKGHQRVMKITHPEYPRTRIMSEFFISKSIDHLAMKQPSWTETEPQAFITLRKLKGKSIYKILSEHNTGINKLTVWQRYQLTKELLIALETQVASKRIVHKDINPSNIMVDLTDEQITVFILDFGGSVLAEAENAYSGGWVTRGFEPPSSFFPDTPLPLKLKHDVFSMARVLAAIWSDDVKLFYDIRKDFDYPYYFLFSGCSGLTYQQKHDIKSLLLGMSKTNPTERLSIQDAIKQCSELTSFTDKHEEAIDPLNDYHQVFLGRMEGLDLLTQDELLRPNELGETLALIAVREGHADIVSYLGKRNALYPRYPSSTMLQPSLRERGGYLKNKGPELLMHLALLNGHAAVVSELLKTGIKAEFLMNNEFIIHYLTKRGYDKLLDVICRQNRFNINKANRKGLFPVSLAAKRDDGNVLEVLATYRANINVPDLSGATPVHIAAAYGHLSALTVLNRLGANLQTPNKKGITPAFIAAQNGQLTIIQFLLHHKVDFTIPCTLSKSSCQDLCENKQLEIKKRMTIIIDILGDKAHPETHIRLLPVDIAWIMGHQTIVDLLEPSATLRKILSTSSDTCTLLEPASDGQIRFFSGGACGGAGEETPSETTLGCDIGTI